jgi:hypothetical protein
VHLLHYEAGLKLCEQIARIQTSNRVMHRPCFCLLHAWRRRNQHDNTHINNPPAAVMEGSTGNVGGTQAAHQKYWHSNNPRASSKLILLHQILRF